MIILFWILFSAFIYAYFGYALLIFIFTRFMRNTKIDSTLHQGTWPTLTLFIAAYNEKNILKEKIENCLSLDYPRDKLKIVFVTDGSDDGSEKYLQQFNGITVYHQPERRGKINAMNRGMAFIESEIVVFTDANTSLNTDAIKQMAEHFFNPRMGCVAGRKIVISPNQVNAAGAGEGMYWKFESWLKKLEARFYAPVGAVGELFAIRRKLFEPVAPDTILDDMMISYGIMQKGYLLTYAPGAIATESASFNVSEELKRKVRIAAGGIQSMIRLKTLLNPLNNWRLAFQFFSHKVSRWTFAPWCFFLLLPLNMAIVINHGSIFWQIVLLLQLLFYILAFIGHLFENKIRNFWPVFMPYYFTAINLAGIRGQFRYIKGKQPAAWDKAKRMQ